MKNKLALIGFIIAVIPVLLLLMLLVILYAGGFLNLDNQGFIPIWPLLNLMTVLFMAPNMISFSILSISLVSFIISSISGIIILFNKKLDGKGLCISAIIIDLTFFIFASGSYLGWF